MAAPAFMGARMDEVIPDKTPDVIQILPCCSYDGWDIDIARFRPVGDCICGTVAALCGFRVVDGLDRELRPSLLVSLSGANVPDSGCDSVWCARRFLDAEDGALLHTSNISCKRLSHLFLWGIVELDGVICVDPPEPILCHRNELPLRSLGKLDIISLLTPTIDCCLLIDYADPSATRSSPM
jgi:hypothetical protein